MDKQTQIKNWFKQRLKLVLYRAESLEAIFTARFNRLGFVLINAGFFIVLFSLFWILIVFTPLKSLIPGYPDSIIRKHMITNKIRIDSLENEINIRDQYLEVLRNAILGIAPIDSMINVPIPSEARRDAQILSNEKQSDPNGPNKQLANNAKLNAKDNNLDLLFPPVKGVITNKFNPAIGHLGTDIVPDKNAFVFAAMGGTVVISNYTIEFGYSVVIQHANNIITVYKHNKELLVSTGDVVKAGSPIAVFGNTGEYSTGPHLHFELWQNGKALNPELYVSF